MYTLAFSYRKGFRWDIRALKFCSFRGGGESSKDYKRAQGLGLRVGSFRTSLLTQFTYQRFGTHALSETGNLYHTELVLSTGKSSVTIVSAFQRALH